MSKLGAPYAKALANVQAEIQQACARAQRSPQDVRLIAVSKAQSIEAILGLAESGQHAFGENYVQEAQPKWVRLANKKLEWHFIGALQSNKVRAVVGVCDYIHSVDRSSLLQEIDKRAGASNLRQKILIEVNFAGEASKSGCDEKQAQELLREAAKLEQLRVCGLMLMPPFSLKPEESRAHFVQARTRLSEWKKLLGTAAADWRELSMGTSQDFTVAIEEGATMIRVGTSLFGARPIEE